MVSGPSSPVMCPGRFSRKRPGSCWACGAGPFKGAKSIPTTFVADSSKPVAGRVFRVSDGVQVTAPLVETH